MFRILVGVGSRMVGCSVAVVGVGGYTDLVLKMYGKMLWMRRGGEVERM